MEIKEKLSIIEAVLFASGEPVEAQKLAGLLDISQDTLKSYIGLLNDRYENFRSGIIISEIENGWQMTTRSDYSEYVRRIIEVKKSAPLTQTALEVLTIIAYNQPVSKGFVESIRGTDSSSTVNSLAEKGLIEEAGRLDVPGKPIVYRTTDVFLRSFGLKSLAELPPLPDRNQQLEFD